MWPTRKKTNAMADAGSGSGTTPPSTSSGLVSNIMQVLGFTKIDFTIVTKPVAGTILMAADLDGKLKMKNSDGYIFEILYT